MFDKLPQECIFKILDILLQSEPWENLRRWDPHNQYIKCWKNKLTSNQLTKWNTKNDLWRLPPFIWMIPLIMLSKGMSSIFDTNDIWTFLYEQEFRKGKPFIPKPKEAKKLLFTKVKGVIKERYLPIIEYHEKNLDNSKTSLKFHLHQIHTIDKSISRITPQIKDENKIDTHIENIGVILDCSVTLPPGFTDPYGNQLGQGWYNSRVKLSTVSQWRKRHKVEGEYLIKKVRCSKESLEKIDNILTKL